MRISSHFQKFFFGVVLPQLKQKATIPLRYQHPLTKEWYLVDLNRVSDQNVYQLLKLINPKYPKLNDLLPASTTVLSNKHLQQHVQWIERWASENGITLPYIEDEWKKIIEESK